MENTTNISPIKKFAFPKNVTVYLINNQYYINRFIEKVAFCTILNEKFFPANKTQLKKFGVVFEPKRKKKKFFPLPQPSFLIKKQSVRS
jgi:hypothetical protein